MDAGKQRNDNAEAAPAWGTLLKGLVMVHVARAAERVLHRREQPETGRLGGSVAAVSTVAVPSEPTARVKTETEAKPVPTRPWPIAKTVFQEFGRDNGTLMAASVAFYLLLSIIPLMLVGVSILGFFLNPSRAAEQAFQFLNQFIPVGKATVNQAIEAVISARGSLGIAGLVGTAVTATGGFATLENAINVLWNRPNRNFVMNKLLAFGMMLVVGLLFLLTMGTSAAIAAAEGVPGLSWLSSSWARPVLGVVIPLALSSLMFAVMYRVYPNGRVSWRSPLIAGFITAVLWEAFKYGYAFYAARDQSPYGIFVGLVMWIFYSAALILLGSELTWVLEGCPGKEEKEQIHATRGRA